jgi:hypothetical protein
MARGESCPLVEESGHLASERVLERFEVLQIDLTLSCLDE